MSSKRLFFNALSKSFKVVNLFGKGVLVFLWWIYSIYALCWAIGLLIFLLPFAVLFAFFKKQVGGTLFYIICHYFAKLWLIVTAIKYEEINNETEKSNLQQQYIYIANHNSYLDIVIMLASMRRPYRPLGKEEMCRIPVFGFFYGQFVITVNRKDSISRAISFMNLNKAIKQNVSVFIFPEGTFNETGQPLKNFSNGPFQLALKTGIRIKPIVFLDNQHRMHYSSIFSIRPGICRVIFLKEIDTNNFMQGQVSELKQDAYTKMKDVINKYTYQCKT